MVKTLSDALITDGLSPQHASILEVAFGTEQDFVTGMDAVVMFLALPEIPEQIPPEGQPWEEIWNAINAAPDEKEKVFIEVVQHYPDEIRDTLMQVVSLKITNRRAWAQSIAGHGNNASKSVEYYVKMLEQLGYRFRSNRCTGNIEVNGQPLTDNLAAAIRAAMRGAGVKEMPAVEDAYISSAERNKYHPIQRYLDNLKWDGEDHIGALAGFFTDKNGMFPAFLRRWLIGAVARSYRVCRNRVLVMDGAQNIGKSRFVRWLGTPMIEYFREGPIVPDDKDYRLALLSTWIWEVGEFGTVARRADREALKSFLTMTTIKDRGAFRKYASEGSAITSFIATANQEMGFFNDPTGTSRFMTVEILGIDWKGYTSTLQADNVWAQAVDLYKNGEDWELSDVERATATAINSEYETLDIVGETINKFFAIEPQNKALWMSSLDILNVIKDPSLGNLRAGTEVDPRKMASALTRMGLEKPKQKRVAGSIERGYSGIRRLP